MPELPEVQTIIDDLKPFLIGARIEKLITITRSIWSNNPCPNNKIAGSIVKDVRRQGKYIIIKLENDKTLIIHLGMTGRLTKDMPGKKPEKHTHFVMEFDSFSLHYNDIRRFGFIDYVVGSKLSKVKYLSKLGPDPFEIAENKFVEIFKSKKRIVKQLLMDQTVVSGLGNIYSDEALFRAGINPLRVSSKISRSRLAGLYNSIVEVLSRAIKARGSSISDYVDGSGNSGNYQFYHSVYGKTGEPCSVCGTPIKRKIIGGRSSHYCPRCQR